MLPLDVVFILLVILWGLIGSVRGFAKEIGATIAVILAMAALRIFGPLIITYFNKFAGLLTSFTIQTGSPAPAGTACFGTTPTQAQFIFYTLFFAVIVYMGYHGQTFGVPTKFGQVPSGVLGLFVGLFNGYLIAGNLWWFLDRCAHYNVPALGIKNVGVLNASSQLLLKVLPFNVLGEPVLLIGILFLLLLLRIAK